MLTMKLALHDVLLYTIVPRHTLVPRRGHACETPRHLDTQWLALEPEMLAALCADAAWRCAVNARRNGEAAVAAAGEETKPAAAATAAEAAAIVSVVVVDVVVCRDKNNKISRI